MSGCLPALHMRINDDNVAQHLPTRMRALTQGTTRGHATLRDNVPLPSCRAGQVLVRVLYAGQNSPDAYALDPELAAAYRNPDHILGSDFCGEVVQTQDDSVPVGAHVCGWLPGGCTTSGSYAQYAVCDADMLVRMPEDRSPAEMAALPFSLFTALHALTFGLKLDVDPGQGDATKAHVLVWGAGTACGFYAAQLLHHAGYGVVAVAGKEAIVRLEKAGVRAITLDREQGDEKYVAGLIRAVVPTITTALDCSATAASIRACLQCVTSNGRIHTLLPAERAMAAEGTSFIPPTSVTITFALVHSMVRSDDAPLSILSMQDSTFSTPAMLDEQHRLAVRWASYDRGHVYAMLRDNRLHLLPVVRWPVTFDQHFGLVGVQEALRRAAANEALPRGKTVHAVQNELHVNLSAHA